MAHNSIRIGRMLILSAALAVLAVLAGCGASATPASQPAVAAPTAVPLTAEALAAADPDCIVVFTSGLETVGGREGLLTVPGVAQTAAGQEGCILDFEGQYIAAGGPRMGSALKELLAAFHPGLAIE